MNSKRAHKGDSSMTHKLDAFTTAYLTAALFTDDPNPGQGEFSERDDWSIACFETDAITQAVSDCERFQEYAGDLIAPDLEHAGRDFWYTRNGHGCGFWDGDWPEADGEKLTDIAKGFSESGVYVGDDGKLWLS